MIAEDGTDISSRQNDRYWKGFNSDLAVSKEFVDEIALGLRRAGLLVRTEDDATPFTDDTGKKVRLWDIVAIHRVMKRTFFFEAKDHARAICYEATGLPKTYIDTRMMLANNGLDLFLIFRDNMAWVNGVAKRYDTTPDKVIANLFDNPVKKRTVEMLPNGTIHFIPYGNKLSVLMQNDNRITSLDSVMLCKWKSHYNEEQYIWDIDAMSPLRELIKTFFMPKKEEVGL